MSSYLDVEKQNWLALTSAELREEKVQARHGRVVVIPVGSCEQHGDHLPVGTDTLIVTSLVKAAVERMPNKALMLPPLWVGYSPHHMGRPGTITLESSTFISILYDICHSLYQQKFTKILIVNGHGGNEPLINVALSEISRRIPIHICSVTYWRLISEEISEIRASPPGGMGHACEFETSLAMYLFPKLVKIECAVTAIEAGDKYFSPEMFSRNLISCYIDYSRISATGVVGDPLVATAEKGRQIFALLVERLYELLHDFSVDRISALRWIGGADEN